MLQNYAVRHICKSVTYENEDKKVRKKCFECLVRVWKSSTFATAIERDTR